MEKITAIFLFLTLIGALLVIASANESNATTAAITPADPKTSLVPSFSSEIVLNNSTTPANTSEGNTTTSTNVTSAAPKTNQTNDVLSTTSKPVSDVTSETNQNNGVNTTTTMSVSKSTPNTTKTKGDKQTPGPEKPTPPTKPPTTKTTKITKENTPTPVRKDGSSARITYIIIILVIILCITGAIGYCCYQNKSRTFSLDRSSKSEDAHIPLSTVEPEVFEASASKDMETFTATETSAAAESSPPAEAVEKKEEEKAPAAAPAAEASQPEKESSAESQVTVPLVEKPEEMSVVDLNDEEQAISTKTSVETLEETPNENNSNNRAHAHGGHMKNANGNFTEINLDDLL